MLHKRNRKQFFLIAAIVFVIIVIIELCVVRIKDLQLKNDSSFWGSVRGRLSEEYETWERQNDYSVIIGRELSEDEKQQQIKLKMKQLLIAFNNGGVVSDYLLSDGTWFLDDEDEICIRISVDRDDKSDHVYFSLKNEEIMNRYRAVSEDSFYSLNEMRLGWCYRYYQLVFDSFYLDGMTIIPEQVSIYRVESITSGDKVESLGEITGFECVDTLKLEVPDVKGLDYYKNVTEIDKDNPDRFVYDYVCNGMEGYAIWNNDYVLNEETISLKERRALLEDCLNETYAKQDRDLVGFSKMFFNKETATEDFWGGEVTAVCCEQNIFYNMYRYMGEFLLLVFVVDVTVALVCAAIVMAIRRAREK